MKTFSVIYEYGEQPLKKATKLVVGELYVTSNGEIVFYNGEEFKTAMESPLTPVQGNTVENLTELQLTLYWALTRSKLIKNINIYDGDN